MDDLRPDPSVALAPPQRAEIPRTGPLRRVQFVVELVGPRSVPAAAAAYLLEPQWHGALGEPQCWAMRPADTAWAPLTNATDGSYDSLAIAWDLLSPRGELSRGSAERLLARAEEFGNHIQRRAMPIPVPDEIDRLVPALKGVREGLDIGFGLTVAPPGFVPESTLWSACARLGLEFSSEGSFDWRAPGTDLPLLSVTPIGVTDRFSLGAAQRGDVHEGVTVGFSVPLCPSPTEALEGAFHVAQVLAEAMGGAILDEEGEILTASRRELLRRELNQAERLFAQAGLIPGSAEAVKLFG